MRFLYIANVRIPTERAHGLQIIKMCESFVELKNDVKLIAPNRFNKIKDNCFDYYDVKNNFRIIKLPCIDLIPLSNFLGSFAAHLELLTFLISVKFFSIFNGYDIIYTREPMVGIFFKDFILELHSLPRFKSYFFYSCIKKAKKLVVLTEGIKKILIEQGVNADKIIVSPDAVDLEQFEIGLNLIEARKKLALPLESKIILYTGHLYSWKGVDTLVEAAKLLPPDYLTVFVGGVEEDVEKFRLKYANIRNILIVGHKPHREIPIYLKAADVLILPNSGKEKISKFYTSPLKLFEYMAARKPIVSSDLPSIREILNDHNSILVDPDNPQKLIQGIKLVFKYPNLSFKISESAYQDVVVNTWIKRAEKIIFAITKKYDKK